MSEYTAIIINNQVAVINNRGENLFEMIQKYQKTSKINHSLGKYSFYICFVLALLFAASMSGFITEHNILFGVCSALSLFFGIVSFAVSTEANNNMERYQRQLNIGCGELEQEIYAAKQRLLSQQDMFKKIIKEKEISEKQQFNF